jgi:MFS family permease
LRTKKIAELRAAIPAFIYYYTVGSVGFWIPLYAKDLGWPYKEVTLLSAIYFLALTPSTFLTGFIADAVGRPNVIVSIGMLGNAITTFLMPFTRSFSLLALLRAVQAISLATSLPIALGILSRAYGTLRGVSIVAVFNGAGSTLGALMGSLLLPHYGFLPLFLSASILSLIAFVAMFNWRVPYKAVGTRGVLRGLKRIPLSVYIAASSLAIRTFFSGGVFSVLSVLFKRVLNLSVFVTGIALAVNPLTQALASPLISKAVKRRELYTYSIGLASTSLVFYLYLKALGLPYSLRTAGVLGAQALLGVVYVTIMISGNTYIISNSPEEIRYTSSSLFSLTFDLGWILGSSVAGFYMDVHGPMSWVRLSLIGCVVAGLVALSAKLFEG